MSEYLIDFNGTQAALRAGYAESGAGNAAYELLMNAEIAKAVDEKIAERLELADLTVDWILRQWKRIAEADPNELCWTRLECCRHCYGLNHDYQWTEPEYRDVCLNAAIHVCGKKCKDPCLVKVPPAPSGGFGFDPQLRPLRECPQCRGEGVERVKIADTRSLTGSARRLYAGVKQTKDGIEIKMRDQDAALQNLAKYFGMVLEKREISGPGGGPVPVANFKAEDLTDDQLAQFIATQGL